MLTAEATDWGGAAERSDPDFDGADELDAPDGRAVGDLAALDDALAVAGALSPAAEAFLADVELAGFVVAVLDLSAAKGAAV